MTRYALRVDASQTAIISALEAAGAVVSVIGKPVDLLVGITAKNGSKRFALFECKDGAKVKSAQKLTKAQVKFFERWGDWPLFVVDSPETARRLLAVLEAQ